MEVVPGGEVADQRSPVSRPASSSSPTENATTGMSVSLDALVAQFLVERHVGVTVDGRDHSRFLAGRSELFDVGHDRLPVGMAERRVVDHDVFFLDAL